MFDVLKINDEILSRSNSEKLTEIFFDQVYLPEIYLTKLFGANVLETGKKLG